MKTYILMLNCGGPSEPRWQCDIHADTMTGALMVAERILHNSHAGKIANSATLWNGDKPVRSWDMDHTPKLEQR